MDSLLDLIHSSLDIHSGGGANLGHTEFVNLSVKLGIIDKVGGGGVTHHLFILQTVFLLPVLLHVERLPFEHRSRALNDGRHYRVDGAEHHRREEHDAETDGKGTQKREHIYRFGS